MENVYCEETQDVRRLTTSLRSILTPISARLDEDCFIVASHSEFILLGGMKLYILESFEVPKETSPYCPTCKKAKEHKGFGVLVENRATHQKYYAFQADDCSCKNITLFLA